MNSSHTLEDQFRLAGLRYAFGLGVFTVLYNIVEGLVSVYFGIGDDTISLFGFGLDSFIEAISAVGICVMVYRMKYNPHVEKSEFEILALKITGWCFYILSVGLSVSIIVNVFLGHKPTSTIAGVIIALVSIVAMLVLIREKKKIGRALHSEPMIADANCNVVCVYMSLVLLASSLLFEIFQFGFIDLVGTAGIIYFSVKEGKEAFGKAKGIYECNCNEKAVAL